MNGRIALAALLLIAAVGGCQSKDDKVAGLAQALTGEDGQALIAAMKELEAMGADAVEPLVSVIRTTDNGAIQFNGLSVLSRIVKEHPEAQTAIDELLDSKPDLGSSAMALGLRRIVPPKAKRPEPPVEPVQPERPAEDPALKEGETLAQWVERNAKSVTTPEMPQFDDVPPEAIELKDRGLKLAFDQNRLPDGVKLIEQALALDPRIPDAYNALYLHYAAGLKDPDAAIAWLTKGVEACPTAGGIHFDLGNAYSDAGRHDDAAAAFKQSISLRFSNASVWFNLANAYGRGGKPADAVPCYRQALELDATHDRAHRNLIIALHQSNDRPAGLKEARLYLERYPTGERAAWAREAIRRLSD